MKTILLTIAVAVILLTSGCTATKPSHAAELSWEMFCHARGYDIHNNTDQAINEYLDTWRGSAEEEVALLNAGVEPF